MKPFQLNAPKQPKRLTLEAFKATVSTTDNTQQLLGQVLGDCHDANRRKYIKHSYIFSKKS